MLPGTARQSDSEKERCGPGTKDKQKSCRTAFPGPEFVLFLHREDFSRHTGLRGVRAGRRRHLRAAAAHDAVPAAGRGYCNAFANYVKATEILKDQTYYIDRETRNGVIVVKNPMVDIQRTYAEEMRKFASLCGLTIDARLKAAAVKSDKTREAITNKFGNI